MFIFAGLLISITSTLSVFTPSYAQQVQLQQQIKPLECVYTTTQTGGGENTNSTCDNQPIPLVTNIVVNSGRPLLQGSFDAARSIMLRVWISGQWYTHGIDSRVTVDANEWTLDLTGLPVALIPGVYTVMIEVETNDGLLLRNTAAATFEVLNTHEPARQLSPPTINGLAPFYTHMILPQTQEAAGMVNPSTDLPLVKNPYQESRRHMQNPEGVTNGTIAFIVSFAIIGFAIGVLYVCLRFIR